MALCKVTDALLACILEVSGVAGAWRECDFKQQKETYQAAALTPPRFNS